MFKVTVSILTKNPGEHFKEVLASVFEQETPWDFEILIIDSGSSDGTVEYISNVQGVRLVQIPSAEFGHGRTRNLALELSTSEFVAMLTHDAKPADKFWLKNLVAAIDANNRIAGAFGRHIAYPDASTLVKRDIERHFDGFLAHPMVLTLDDRRRYETDQGYRQLLHFFSDNNAILRKSVWEKIPYPDVNFAEDQIWAQRVLEAGYGKAYVDSAAVYHSHNYGLKDTLRRSYDEAVAFKDLFGYELVSGLAMAILQSIRCTLADIRYLMSVDRAGDFFAVIKAPFLNLSKQLGYWLGVRGGRASRKKKFLSLDEQLKDS